MLSPKMPSPFGLYPDLVEKRKTCRICVDRNPGKIFNGASLIDSDPDVISHWSQWLGHPNPRVLIVGQDFGDFEYFTTNKGKDFDGKMGTNDKLLELMRIAGLTPRRPPQLDADTRVFLTNSILCLKEPPMDRNILDSWVSSCAANHLEPLVQRLKPPIIVAMGRHAWRATRLVLRINDAPKNITTAAGGTWKSERGVQLFPVVHCGRLKNRPWPKQLEDWHRIGEALKLVP